MSEDSTPEEYKSHLKRQGFILGKVLGNGLSGSVYEAEQPSLGRKVAVKFFDSAFVRDDEAMRKRFSRESRLLAKFQHQGIPYVLTEGFVEASHGKTPYFVMEHVEGKTLREILNDKNSLSLETSIDYARQILDALGYAHARNIIHRDVKPGNVLIDERNRCFLIDFSIGVSLQPESGLTRATVSGDQLGTTAYMAPEQLTDSSRVDARTDIYAVGVVLFEMLTGRTDRTNMSKALMNFPHSLLSCIEMACAAKAAERYQTAEEFIRSLGGRSQILAPALQPALAICPNRKCSGADWSPNGYYRGPRVIEDSSASFCTNCGGKLRYRCSECGAGVVNAPYCGNCGDELFTVPTCKKCGSYLKAEDLDRDTTNGCSKCGKRKATIETKPVPNFSDMDDDIPF
ncbi:serine/threonine protein kinase [Herbaspirillum sp. HC18]|nr:serine/threonine protein kinase [Herbaspirillum sp. HC18]